jgi:mRNA-degrading endonuclease toxin of MazEF toxin-antitoxin module
LQSLVANRKAGRAVARIVSAAARLPFEVDASRTRLADDGVDSVRSSMGRQCDCD